MGQEVVGEVGPVGCHGVGGGYGTQGHGAFVGAFVAHHSHALHGQEYHAGLPNLVVEIPVAQALYEDVVGFLQDVYFFGGDVAEDAYGKSGTGEGVTRYEAAGNTELGAHGAHFVFEEEAQGFAQPQVHAFGESAHVVMAFDSGAGDGETFDAVGVDGALGEPSGVGDFFCFFFEDVDEAFTDDFAFAFGVGDSGEFGEEFC